MSIYYILYIGMYINLFVMLKAKLGSTWLSGGKNYVLILSLVFGFRYSSIECKD